ncbi:MAG: hypothetical protein KKB30_05550 [Proteobacteria bacterium]|nr:hypothetical protein [Pseudomonadota bacterium]MBU1716165.1 hypothetical protein [Pseudomonadota bacterium]
MSELKIKHLLLREIYRVYDDWGAGLDFVCARGCSTCCTRSVTMTTLEGELIDDFLRTAGHDLAGILPSQCHPSPSCTINQFAHCCLRGQEPPSEKDDFRSFEPCVFLAERSCTIYPVRPFGCRSFGSTIRCDEHNSAEAEPWFITLNSVVLQFIEHLDRGRHWGNMLEVLRLISCENSQNPDRPEIDQVRDRLLLARSIPGFLVPPEEAEKIEGFVGRLNELQINGMSFQAILAA